MNWFLLTSAKWLTDIVDHVSNLLNVYLFKFLRLSFILIFLVSSCEVKGRFTIQTGSYFTLKLLKLSQVNN